MPWPAKDYGKFAKGDTYIVLNTIEPRKKIDLFFWLGSNATVDELLAMFTWEFQHMALLHNGPLMNPAAVADDTNMVTTLTNGYLQSVAQRYVMGVEPLRNLQGEGYIMPA